MRIKSINGWIIKRVKNPCPKQWPGPWFSFSRMCYGGIVFDGKAHYSTLAHYVNDQAIEDLRRRFPKIRF